MDCADRTLNGLGRALDSTGTTSEELKLFRILSDASTLNNGEEPSRVAARGGSGAEEGGRVTHGALELWG